MARIRTKVCCISSEEEAQLAVAHGVDVLGLLGDMETSPRAIPMDLARRIARGVPESTETWLLTAARTGAAIARHAAYCGTTAVQICQHIDVDEYHALIELAPSVKRVQVLHVLDRSALDLLNAYGSLVDAFVLDGGHVGGSAGQLGGTGRVHDWSISAECVQRTSQPVFLAGGLTPANVQAAIATVAPSGLDVCTGVRRDTRLDGQLLSAFMDRVREGRA